MAKIIDYPRASLRASLQLADAVDGFAGNCSVELAAEKLGKKISGAFKALVSSAAKYGVINNKAGKLTTTPLYREYKLAYTPEESTKHLRSALLLPPLFSGIYSRFKGQKLPIAHFEKMLVREFDVPANLASRVAGYFLDGAKQVGLLNSENALIDSDVTDNSSQEGFVDDFNESDDGTLKRNLAVESKRAPGAQDSYGSPSESGKGDDFWLNIRGPGINFSIEIRDTDDLEIVHVMLRKVAKALKDGDMDSQIGGK